MLAVQMRVLHGGAIRPSARRFPRLGPVPSGSDKYPSLPPSPPQPLPPSPPHAPLQTGVWGLPVPRPQPLMMCVGSPIPVPYVDPAAEPERFEAVVAAVHGQVVAAFQDLYNRYRVQYGCGWERRPLEVC